MDKKNYFTQNEAGEFIEVEGNLFNQTELDDLVGNRLNRQKDKFAKDLGIEKYTDENMETYLKGITEKTNVITSHEETISKLKNDITTRDFNLSLVNNGINEKYHKYVKNLATMEMQGNAELSIDQAIENIVKDMPMVKTDTVPPRAGMTPSHGVDGKTEQQRYIEQREKEGWR